MIGGAYLLLAVQNSVEICETRTLYRRPGIDVLMCGKQPAYTVRVEPQRLRSSLFGIPLKSRLLGLGAELLVHEWEGSDITGEIGDKILAAEASPGPARPIEWPRPASEWGLRDLRGFPKDRNARRYSEASRKRLNDSLHDGYSCTGMIRPILTTGIHCGPAGHVRPAGSADDGLPIINEGVIYNAPA